MPAAFAAGILPVELALHAWDQAQSRGQAVNISDQLVDYLRDLAEGVVCGARLSAHRPGLSLTDATRVWA